RDVPDFALVAGVPGKIVGWVCQRGHRLQFGSTGVGKCGTGGG
ncbi:MAG: N-acetyltransferase, partial [Candidatus Marinimicrobia bacterium CG_4_9_14_3_um_filter_48_9]